MRSAFSAAVLTAFAVCTVPALAQEDDPRPTSIPTSALVRIDSAAPGVLGTALLGAGFDEETLEENAHSVEIIVTPGEYDLLRSWGLHPVVLHQGQPLAVTMQQAGAGLDNPPPGYKDNAEILLEMQQRVASHPNLCRLVDIAAAYGPGATHEGRPIWAMVISDNVAMEEGEPRSLIVSAHHCREIGTPVTALYAIEQLLTNYASDPRIRSLVDDNEIWIIPVHNPDGYHTVFTTDELWRKNRRPVGGSIGIDLNRNYPTGWSASCAGSSNPASSTYKGPSPASEAETQALMELTRDRRFERVLDFHSSGRETLYGYRCNPFPLQSWYQGEAIALSNAAGYGGSVRPASAEGEHYQWQLNEGGAYSFLTETLTSFQPAYSVAQAEAVQLWNEILLFLERPVSARGHVRDAQTWEPLEVPITTTSLNYTEGETRTSRPDGEWFYWASPGSKTLTFDLLGYVAQNVSIPFSNSSTVVQDIDLEPDVYVTPFGPTRVGQTAQFICSANLDPDLRFLVLPSLSTTPGIPLGQGRVLQGNFDLLTELALAGLFQPVTGRLNSLGTAVTAVNIPNDGLFLGFQFVLNFVTLENGVPNVRHVSRPYVATVGP